MNLIVGQNNAGKTALLDSFDHQRFTTKPHNDLTTNVHEILDPISKFETFISFSGSELYGILMGSGDGGVTIGLNTNDVEQAKTILEHLFELKLIDYSLSYSTRTGWSKGSQDLPSPFSSVSAGAQFQFIPSPDRTSWQVLAINGSDNLPGLVAQLLTRSSYVFKAERLNVGQSPAAGPASLATDASNLAACLLDLQANSHRFARFVSVVQEIMPSVKGVSARVVSNSVARISVWNADPSTEREDLTVSLEDCGTGVGQVLAIIYAVMESRDRKILVIDEPNSFLHPSASRKLVDILARYEHQYIISTHSPEIITSRHSEAVHILKRGENHSVVESVTSQEVSALRDVLSEVGVRLSDLLGAEAIIWVEGQTEAVCFPLLLDAVDTKLLRGVSIIAVQSTGKFESKRDKGGGSFDIYERLSRSNALVPPSVAFVFDKERRSDEELIDLRKRGKGKVFILPRKLYENYLLDYDAISEIINRDIGPDATTSQIISNWFVKNIAHDKYYKGVEENKRKTEDWIIHVDAAKLLDDLFDSVSSSTLEYTKTKHSVALTKWLIKNRQETISEVSEFLVAIARNPG